MKPADDREEVLFWEALERPKGPEREAYLDQACAGNDALRNRLAALLQADESPHPYLEPQVGDLLGHSTARSAPDFTAEEAGARIGRYKLLEKIGEGGCGVVYMAEQEEPIRRRVAFKVIKLGMDTKQVIARFESERQALALMDHPNIAKVLDAGATDTGRPYFVMELVRGTRITDYCDQNNLSTEERLNLFVQVCHAIQHAHQKGIIHRDIKPSNILVTLHDGVPVPKVIDFGIAKATTGQRLTDKTLFTAFEQFIGTPAYMSPEQAEMSGLDVDTRSDIYALGVLLYELLTGQTPFEQKALVAAGLDEMRRIIREQEPVRPSTRLSTLADPERTTVAKRHGADPPQLIHLVRGDLDWIVMKALEKDRTRRYETANGLADEVLRHLNNEPVAARPPSKAYRLQKAWRRNRMVFTAAAVVVAALMVGIGISTWQAVVATRAKTDALQAKTKSVAAQKEAERAQGAEKAMRIEAEHQLYAAKMNVAQRAWDENNIGRLQELLRETQDSPYRGFEWYYWQPKTHLALKTLQGHLGQVMSVAYSPDGQRIVSGSSDQTAKVWEAATGKELFTLKGHCETIQSVGFSPDGRRIITGSLDRTAKVWDSASGKELLTLKGHTNWIWSVAFSPDGQRIVTGSWDQTAKVWDAASGKELLTLKGHRYGVMSVAFSPDGRRLLTGSFDGTAKVWDAASGKELLTLKGHTWGNVYAAFSPDGQRIVTGGLDATTRVWDAASGKELLMIPGHGNWIWSVAFSPDGQRILTGSEDLTARVWDAASGRELLTLKGHSAPIWSVAFSPDGQRIVTGSFDSTARVWDATGRKEQLTLKGHGWSIRSVAFSRDDRRIVTGSRDLTAKVWDAASGKELLTFPGHSDWINSVAFSPDGRRIVTGSDDKTAKVWEVASGRKLVEVRHWDRIASVAFSPDGQRILTGSSDRTAKVWEATNGKELLTLKGHRDSIESVAYSPNGQRIITGSADNTAKVWDAASGKEVLTLGGHSAGIFSVAYSPDGQRIITGGVDGIAKVWEAATGRELLTLKAFNQVSSVGFSPDGQRIVTGSTDGTAKVWDAASGKELLTLKHNTPVFSVAFAPDGQRIVTGSHNSTVTVWEAARPEQIAAWQEEDRVAAQHLADLERECTAEQERQRSARARDSIRQWLILAPIALATGQSGAEGLDIEQIEGEGQLRPQAGETRSNGGGDLKWRQVALEDYDDYVIDFNAILGRETTLSVAYAVCYLRSEAEQRGLRMLVGSDDEAKVYLNGKQVYKAPAPHGIVAVQDTVPDIALNAGLNVLVFKVVNETEAWKGSIRFTDAAGQPLKGVRVTLDPEAKD